MANRTITYAQKKLLDLIAQRKLRAWCAINNISHSAAFKIANGEYPATYTMMSSLCHLIPPIEWLYHTEEKPPYKPRCLPQWDLSRTSIFFVRHASEWKEIAALAGISKAVAYNIFVLRKTKPTATLIRACDTLSDPADFFTDGSAEELLPEGLYFPAQGDIVSFSSRAFLILSGKAFSKTKGRFICCPVEAECKKDGLALVHTKTKGVVLTDEMATYNFNDSPPPFLIEKADKRTLAAVIARVKKNFV